jgi:uncharacterized membrane protein
MFPGAACPLAVSLSNGKRRGSEVTELVMLGFADRHRAAEVLSQLQRLKFDWSADLHNGIAVEVQPDGRLRMLRSQLLDPAADENDNFQWEAFLSAIVPQRHLPFSARVSQDGIGRTVNAQGRSWLNDLSFDQDFARNAAAILQPGNSAILATIHDWLPAVTLLSGYTSLVLHTTIVRSKTGSV